MEIQQATIVEILPTKIWIESDLFGGRHVVLQHETCDPFTYASFSYDYRYTSNSGTLNAAETLALQLGATQPLEHKTRPLPSAPSRDHLRKQIESLQFLLDTTAA